MDVTLRHLEQIRCLERCGSFAKAARELNLSQPALSRSIAILEDQLGIKLFDRNRKKLAPTLFGQHLLEKGELVLQEMKLLHRDLELLKGIQAGEINIGCGPFPAESFIGDAIATFHGSHPAININIQVDKTSRLISLLRQRELDLVVADCRTIYEEDDLEIIELKQQQGYFCCRPEHPLFERGELAVREILDFPMAIMWLPPIIITLLNDISGLRLTSLTELPSGVIQCDSFSLLFTIISRTDAIGITSKRVLARSAFEKKVVPLPLTLPDFQTKYGIISLAGISKPPAVEELDHLIYDAAAIPL